MTSDLRINTRVQTTDESRLAWLLMGENQAEVELEDTSIGGYAVLAPPELDLAPGMLVAMRIGGGWVQAQVVRSEEYDGRRKIGLKHLNDLEDTEAYEQARLLERNRVCRETTNTTPFLGSGGLYPMALFAVLGCIWLVIIPVEKEKKKRGAAPKTSIVNSIINYFFEDKPKKKRTPEPKPREEDQGPPMLPSQKEIQAWGENLLKSLKESSTKSPETIVPENSEEIQGAAPSSAIPTEPAAS